MNGRNKGNVAEREIAKMLEAWWTPVEPGIKFVRTPLSGGWGGPSLRGEFQASGDVMTTSKAFPWSVEVKRREGWTWKMLLAGKASPVWGWWDQALGQAEEMGKEPLLFFRHNREPWHVMYECFSDEWVVRRSENDVRLGMSKGLAERLSQMTRAVTVDPWDDARVQLLDYGRSKLKVGKERGK